MRPCDHSEETILEGHQHSLLLVQHHIEQTPEGQVQLHTIYPKLVPFVPVLILGVELLVALLDGVGWDVGVEMVHVVVFDSIREGTQEVGDFQHGAALHCSLHEVPLLLVLPIGQVDRVLQVEEDVAHDTRAVDRQPHLPSRDAKHGQQPGIGDNRQGLFQEGHTEDAVSLDDQVEDPYEPSKRNRKREVDNGLSEDPCQYFLDSLHLLVLFLGEEDGLREVESIQIPEMFVMVVVSVPPGIEREMRMYADQFSNEDIGTHAGEEGEMRHIVQLHEEPQVVESEEGPAQHPHPQVDQQRSHSPNSHRDPQSDHRLFVVGLAEGGHEFAHAGHLRVLLLSRHDRFLYWAFNTTEMQQLEEARVLKMGTCPRRRNEEVGEWTQGRKMFGNWVCRHWLEFRVGKKYTAGFYLPKIFFLPNFGSHLQMVNSKKAYRSLCQTLL